MIHPVVHDAGGKLYCGPTALAALTGFPTSKVFKMVRRVRADRDRKHYDRVPKGGGVLDINGRKKPIKSMQNHEMLTVLHRAGLKSCAIGVPENHLTLGQFCDDKGHMGPFLVNVSHHYVVVYKGQIIDTMTKRAPIPWREYKKLRTKVVQWWRF